MVNIIVKLKPNFIDILPNALAITNYAITPRYPDDTHEPTIGDAQQAYQNALIIKDFILKNFFE